MAIRKLRMNHYEQGFTLVELLVTTAIIGLIIAGIYNLFDAHNRMAAKQEETTLMQQELLSLMVMMSDELRMCGYSPVDSSNFGFESSGNRQTNSSRIYCTRDTDFGNGTLATGPEIASQHIGFGINPNNIPGDDHKAKRHDDGWFTAATNIRDLNFTYFDIDGAEITDPSNNLDRIRSVQINATATASPERSGMNIPDRQMSSTVFCRNMAGR